MQAVLVRRGGEGMEPICDLHTHSYFSDGTLSPSELIEKAEQAGLSAIVLSDHNTVAGVPEFLAAAQGKNLEAVPGIEFSTEYEGTELHILALYVKPCHYEAVTAVVQAFLNRKDQSNIKLVQRLNEAGLKLDYEKIKADAAGSINRAVIGAEMVRLGYCESVKQAFSDWLSPKKGYYVPPLRPDAFETIRFIKSIGAVAVLAHPFLNLDEQRLRVFLQQAVKAGLDGMEVYYSLYSEETTALAKKIAAEFELLESGGSDFHGGNKPDISLGTGKGNLVIPMTLLEKLKTKCN